MPKFVELDGNTVIDIDSVASFQISYTEDEPGGHIIIGLRGAIYVQIVGPGAIKAYDILRLNISHKPEPAVQVDPETGLAPCPWCGGKAEYQGMYVACSNYPCSVIGPSDDPIGAKWNALRRG